jgi:hypothetical protein
VELRSKKPNFWEVKPYDTFQPWQDQYTYYITHKNSFRRTDFLEYRLNKNGKASVPLGFFLSRGFVSVWVDKSNLHILRLRTDLLSPQPDIGLDQQTTTVTFTEVRFADVATPLWLPGDVGVYMKFGFFSAQLDSEDSPTSAIVTALRPGETFRNVHHYSNYRRYRVTTKMLVPK